MYIEREREREREREIEKGLQPEGEDRGEEGLQGQEVPAAGPQALPPPPGDARAAHYTFTIMYLLHYRFTIIYLRIIYSSG